MAFLASIGADLASQALGDEAATGGLPGGAPSPSSSSTATSGDIGDTTVGVGLDVVSPFNFSTGGGSFGFVPVLAIAAFAGLALFLIARRRG